MPADPRRAAAVREAGETRRDQPERLGLRPVAGVGGERRHLAAGELWEINNWRVHHVENRGESDRVHLLIDWDAPATSRRDAA